MSNKKLEKNIERIVYILGGVGNIESISGEYREIRVRKEDKVKEKYFDLFGIMEKYTGPTGVEELYYKVYGFNAFEKLHDFVTNRKFSEEYKEQLREKIDKEMEMENE